jgi:hypothetical protein
MKYLFSSRLKRLFAVLSLEIILCYYLPFIPIINIQLLDTVKNWSWILVVYDCSIILAIIVGIAITSILSFFDTLPRSLLIIYVLIYY